MNSVDKNGMIEFKCKKEAYIAVGAQSTLCYPDITFLSGSDQRWKTPFH
jgi:hypothetical protein